MEDNKIIDQSQLAESVAEKIQYDFTDTFLVKLLDVTKVKKEFSKPVSDTAKASKDKNGVKAVDYEKVETEVKEVESDFRKAVVIKLPVSYNNMKDRPYDVNVGDVVLIREGRGIYFDLLKDSKLIYYYDIVAICK